jgi:hypothetical protein
MEIWKTINGFDDYQVSNLGRVKSFKRGKEKILADRKRKGYLSVCLSNINIKYVTNHRLVAESFLPNINNKPCINHINGIKHDNRVENLEWVTHSENTQHAFDTGLHKITQKHLLSIKKANSKKVIDTEKNIIYSSLTDAAKNNKISVHLLWAMLNNKVKNKTNIKYYE